MFIPQPPEFSNGACIGAQPFFGMEQADSELDNGPDNNLDACRFYSLPVDSFLQLACGATMEMGMPEATPVTHAVILVP